MRDVGRGAHGTAWGSAGGGGSEMMIAGACACCASACRTCSCPCQISCPRTCRTSPCRTCRTCLLWTRRPGPCRTCRTLSCPGSAACDRERDGGRGRRPGTAAGGGLACRRDRGRRRPRGRRRRGCRGRRRRSPPRARRRRGRQRPRAGATAPWVSVTDRLCSVELSRSWERRVSGAPCSTGCRLCTCAHNLITLPSEENVERRGLRRNRVALFCRHLLSSPWRCMPEKLMPRRKGSNSGARGAR